MRGRAEDFKFLIMSWPFPDDLKVAVAAQAVTSVFQTEKKEGMVSIRRHIFQKFVADFISHWI